MLFDVEAAVPYIDVEQSVQRIKHVSTSKHLSTIAVIVMHCVTHVFA